VSGLTGEALARKSAELITLLQSKLGSHIVEAKVDLGDAVIRISPDGSLEFFKLLKLDSELRFNLLIDITVVDWLDQRDNRFDVVYQFLSLETLFRVRVSIGVPEEKPEVESVVSLWSGANYFEREAWDMYGVTFHGHPDMRRILMYDEFEGYPLRKDYPVQGKQPRIPLRSPEVRNTALDMNRPALVSINTKKKALAAQNN
jgi:NADH-quinone oxidoreductase subunit C